MNPDSYILNFGSLAIQTTDIYYIYTHALSPLQEHRRFGETRLNFLEREVQEEIDSAPPDMVI